MILQILTLCLVALGSGLMYPMIKTIIGYPILAQNPNLKMDFEAGRWLCDQQNRFEKRHDLSRIHVILIPTNAEKMRIETSYGRGGWLKACNINEFERLGFEVMQVDDRQTGILVQLRLFHGEDAMVDFQVGENTVKAVSEPFNKRFDRVMMPLSIYKALGLCGICTTFWILISNLLICYSIGLIDPWAFLLIPVLYGVSIWASKYDDY